MSSSLARVRVVSINDVYELANLPRVQTFLTKLSPHPSAVVLAGDFLSPSTLSSIDNGRGMVVSSRIRSVLVMTSTVPLWAATLDRPQPKVCSSLSF